MVDQWTPIDVREMRTGWSVAPQTAAKNMSTVKAFFEYCVANDWIEKSPARLVKNQRGREAAVRVEAAAERALLTGACRYQSVKSILKNSLDALPAAAPPASSPPPPHDNIRGAEYFE
jgi:site-specific recombinase XerD